MREIPAVTPLSGSKGVARSEARCHREHSSLTRIRRSTAAEHPFSRKGALARPHARSAPGTDEIVRDIGFRVRQRLEVENSQLAQSFRAAGRGVQRRVAEQMLAAQQPPLELPGELLLSRHCSGNSARRTTRPTSVVRVGSPQSSACAAGRTTKRSMRLFMLRRTAFDAVRAAREALA